MSIVVRCPGCKSWVGFENANVRQTGECPKCHRQFRVRRSRRKMWLLLLMVVCVLGALSAPSLIGSILEVAGDPPPPPVADDAGDDFDTAETLTENTDGDFARTATIGSAGDIDALLPASTSRNTVGKPW